MDSSTRKSNKIRDIVRLQQILKKWKKVANNNKSASSSSTSCPPTTTTTKSIKFLKKTLSFSESSSSSSQVGSNSSVPKGYVAVCVGKELKRFVIRTEYLRHQMFGMLLREAEEEFGFQHEGVLKFPCEVDLFEKILKMIEDKSSRSFSSPSLLQLHLDHHQDLDDATITNVCSNNYSPDAAADIAPSHHHPAQMCR